VCGRGRPVVDFLERWRAGAGDEEEGEGEEDEDEEEEDEDEEEEEEEEENSLGACGCGCAGGYKNCPNALVLLVLLLLGWDKELVRREEEAGVYDE
jgi:hypothetical protein